MPHGGVRLYKSSGTFGSVGRSKKNAKHVYRVTFYRDYGTIKVHRIVCDAFHGPAPFPEAVVMHLDENALNNRPDNLRWGTQKENLNSPKFLEYCRNRTGDNSPWTKGMRRREAA